MSDVSLRALEPEDLDFLYAIENDRQLWGVGVTTVPCSRYALRDYIAHASTDIFTDKQVRLMIEDHEGNAVGIVDLVNFDPRHARAEVGIVVHRDARRRGLALAALLTLAEYARQVLHLHQLYALMDERNVPSVQLFQRAGFSRSAVLTDWLFDEDGYHDACLMQLFFKK